MNTCSFLYAKGQPVVERHHKLSIFYFSYTFSYILGGKNRHRATPKTLLKIPHKTTCEVLLPLLWKKGREYFFLLSFRLTILSSHIRRLKQKIFSIQYFLFVSSYLQLNFNSTYKISVLEKTRREPALEKL